MITIMRATQEWQRAGAYYVRIQAMMKQHHISMRNEFDEHDGEGSLYVVLLDDGFPVATCRIYAPDESSMMIGRLVVLEDYRGMGLAKTAMNAAEEWIRELGRRTAVLESRMEVIGFYEKLGYRADYSRIINGPTFRTVHMEKTVV